MNYKEMLEAAKSHRVTHPLMQEADKGFWVTFCEGCKCWHNSSGEALADEYFQIDLQEAITDNPALEENWEIVKE